MENISIEHKIEQFKTHILDNKRVILSAKFGDGKTCFLEQVKETLSNEFYFITLYPVNYAVAKNEDVFEYIKRDILLQLANDGILSNIDFEAVANSIFCWENLREVISFLLSCVSGGEFYKKLLVKAEKFKKEYDKRKSTWDKYNLFFTNQKGGLYEHDAYTKMIESGIEYIGNPTKPQGGKKPVLIIEDLDRIDPGHLFRILNVLGAHIDTNKDENKFGFENIVVVLDYITTEHIFHHFYGQDANYYGYMSKFMSCYPFEYSIKEIAKDYVYDYIEKECKVPRNIAFKIDIGFKYEKSVRQPETLDSYLNKISVRDIAHALDNINNQFIEDTIILRDSFKVSTNSGLIKFLSLIKRLGIDFQKAQLYKTILDLRDKSILDLLGIFILIDENFDINKEIKVGAMEYRITIKEDNNGFSYASFMSGYMGTSKYLNENMFYKVTSFVGKYIKDF